MAGTASSETVLPRLVAKLEHLGCAKSVVGLVIPTGYSFNLDGTSIYMAMAAIFIAQATNTPLTPRQQVGILGVLLPAIPVLPVAGLGLLLGIDPIMSRARSLTNLVGNAVGTLVVARWEGALDTRRMNRILNGETVDEADEPEKVLLTEVHATRS